MKTLVIQSYRRVDVPWWINHCLASVRSWAQARNFTYEFHGDEFFDLCGPAYLARVGENVRSRTNLARLIAAKDAHRRMFDRAVWLDADVLVFDAEHFQVPVTDRYAFARETWVWRTDTGVSAVPGVNNCAFVFMQGEPDLDLLITVTKHVAMYREIKTNYQVGGHLLKGLRASLDFATWDNIGMLSPYVIKAVAEGNKELLALQARSFGSPIHAANLAAGDHYWSVGDSDLGKAIELLDASRGDVINSHLLTMEPIGGR